MTYRIFLYVQHLLGIGHLMRTYRIAKSLASSGLDVTVVNGGLPAPSIDCGLAKILQLPPVKAGPTGFSELVHPNGAMFSQADKFSRRDTLLRHFQAIGPHALITEAFPFGRRQMRFELLPLLEVARQQRTLIAASIRDILQEQKISARSLEATDIIERFYDVVLVHGTPDFTPLDASFAPIDRIRDRVMYTGIVGPEENGEVPVHDFDVIVSAGGGAVGEKLIRTALQIRRLTKHTNSRWFVVTGPNMPDSAANDLRELLDGGVTLVRFAADLPSLLRGANLSISQAGYNTVADLLAARCRSVIVPFDEGGETEQTRRSEILARKGLAVVVASATLNPETLLAGIRKARALPDIDPKIDLNGAANTAIMLRALLQQRFSDAQSR